MAKKGHIVTEEHRRKLSESHKGKIPWNKGLRGIYSDETIQKMRDNSKGKNKGHITSEETKEKIRMKLIGKIYGPPSEETKEKMRKALKGRPNPHPNRKSRKGIPTGIIPPSAFKKGCKAWNFIDGRSSRPDLKNRYGSNWIKIRKQAIIRDGYTCQKCGIDGVFFEVHHIISYLLTRDNSLDNLVTLCGRCHRKIEALEMKMLKSKEVA